MWVWSLGWEDPLEEGMATHSSILAWRIPCTEEPGGLWFIISQTVGCDWSNGTHKYIITKLKMGSPCCLLFCFHVNHSNLLPSLYVNSYLNSKKSASHHPESFSSCSIPVYMDNSILIVTFGLHGKQLF